MSRIRIKITYSVEKEIEQSELAGVRAYIEKYPRTHFLESQYENKDVTAKVDIVG